MHGACLWIAEAQDQADRGALSRATRADEGDALACIDLKREVLVDRNVRLARVAELDILDGDGTVDDSRLLDPVA